MASGNLMSSEGWDDTVLVGIFDAAVKSHTTTDKKFAGKGMPGPWMEVKGELASPEDTGPENGIEEENDERGKEEDLSQTNLPSVSEFEDVSGDASYLKSFMADMLDDLNINDTELNAAVSEGYQQMQQAWYQAGYQAGRYETLLLLRSMRQEKSSSSTGPAKKKMKKKKTKKKKAAKKGI